MIEFVDEVPDTPGTRGEFRINDVDLEYEDNKKQCTKCKQVKSKLDFGNRKQSADGLQWQCKTCISSKTKEYYNKHKGNRWADKNPEKRKETQRKAIIKHKYGITVEEYETFLESQNDACKLCTAKHDLCIDHDHETNKVRGILCRPCNFFLGQVENKGITWLSEAYKYLGWHSAWLNNEDGDG